MTYFNEDSFSNWTKPPSDTEETKLTNAVRMVKEAISEDTKLSTLSIETFGQGSYANDTNVKLNSDIDINVKYTGAFYYDLPFGTKESDFNIVKLPPTAYSFNEFKNDVQNALIQKFGQLSVKRKNKCLFIEGNSYRVDTDVVPTWDYRRYSENGSFVLGTRLNADNGGNVNNFPLQHIDNVKAKNDRTSKRFKRLTRIYRKLRYKMMDENESISNNITSFLIECLVWNVPDNVFNDYDTWTDRLKQSIIHLYNYTQDEKSCKEWGEVSELLYLFYSERKWSRIDVNNYLIQAWNYLGF